MSNAVFDSLTNRGDTRSEGNESSVDNDKLAGENLAKHVYKVGENCWKNVLNTGAAAEQEMIDELLGPLVISSGDQAVSEFSGAGGADGRERCQSGSTSRRG